MTREIKLLIGGSIKKWVNIRFYDGVDQTISNCSLCHVFHLAGCIICPIKQKTGLVACQGTPYSRWAEHQSFHKIGHNNEPRLQMKVHCPECEKIADDEIAFLKSLFEEV